MGSSNDDSEAYHQDFTTASDWEVFVDGLEKIINNWRLTQPKTRGPMKEGDLEGEWDCMSEEIAFSDDRFSFTFWSLKDENIVNNVDVGDSNSPLLPQALIDTMALQGDFVKVLSCPPVSQMYGLRDFLLLSPALKATVASETKAKMLLSSATMALNASGCEIPIFVQVFEPWQNYFLGYCAGKTVCADFEMVHLQRTPQHCKYLTGLLETFKAKIGRGLEMPSVTVSACLTYSLKFFNVWDGSDSICENQSTAGSLGKLPLGTLADPVSELHLLAIWPQLNEQMVVDSPSYSDLEPMHAPIWAVKTILIESTKSSLLSKRLACLCKLSAESVDLASSKDPKLSHSLDVLTESRVPTISKVIGHVKAKALASKQSSDKRKQGIFPEQQLMKYLYFLFPDADENKVDKYDDAVGKTSSVLELVEMEGVKSVPPDSLVWRLSIVMSDVYSKYGIRAVAQLWDEFTEEMRYRWENTIPVPGVAPGFADHKTCVLHQKLQMLNVCIERMVARGAAAAAGHKGGSGSGSGPGSVDSEGEDDDQFFDCNATTTSREDWDMEDAADAAEEQKHSLWNQPEGRKHKHPTLRLLRTGDPLYVPVTQDLVPKTEDELESSELSQAKAYMMSATLSDMESFKAANPSGSLEDFIRWYSPRDWVEDPSGELDQWGQRKGQLSARMQLPDNTWLELWGVAQPVAACRQRRLFDETRSAELVLSWLEGLGCRTLALALLPALAHACAARLGAEAQQLGDVVPTLQPALERLQQHVLAATREPVQAVKSYQKLVGEISEAERLISQFRSLVSKLCPAATAGGNKDMLDFIAALMSKEEVRVPGGPRGHIGNNIKSMFAEAQKRAQLLPDAPGGSSGSSDSSSEWSPVSTSAFPAADTKEMVMRLTTPRPGPGSAPCPQRMYALHHRNEFKLAGCFSRDALFY